MEKENRKVSKPQQETKTRRLCSLLRFFYLSDKENKIFKNPETNKIYNSTEKL